MRLLHFADTHIGTETYGRIDAATGRHTRLQDFARSLDQAVDVALDAGVDAALFAGDAYRTSHPSPTHQQVFAAAINRLASAGVPVVMVVGNHDQPVAHGRANALDIFGTLASERVTVAHRPALLTVATRSGPLQVACLPWPTGSLLRSRDDAVDWTDERLRAELVAAGEAAIDQLAGQLDPAVPGVLLAHVLAADAVFSGSEKSVLVAGDPALPLGALADRRFDYVALGHLHRHQVLAPERQPAVVYAGSIDRLDFGEAGDVKGVCLVDIGDGGEPAARTTTWRHHGLSVRPFISLNLDAPADAELTGWLAGRLAAAELAEAVVRVRYTCTDEQYDSLNLSDLRPALEPAFLVAGLVRDRPEPLRRPRAEVTEHHRLDDALSAYLDTRPELAGWRGELLSAAAELEREIDALADDAPST